MASVAVGTPKTAWEDIVGGGGGLREPVSVDVWNSVSTAGKDGVW